MAILKNLLAAVPEARIIGDENTPVDQLFYDPRKLTAGSALVCVDQKYYNPNKVLKSALVCVPNDQDFEADDAKRGTPPIMAAEAVKRGATVIIADDESAFADLPDSIAKVVVPDTRRALALMAAEFYGHPSRKLLLVGITGTNGKTTTAALIAQVLRRQGLSSVGVIGTLGATSEKTYFDTGCTTPRSLDTQRLLAEFVDSGAEAVVIEVSSHGLGLQRCVGCAFDFAVYTNFSQDHLDFHGSMQEYWDTKMLFFTELARYSLQYKPFTAIVNIDDEKGKELVGRVVSGYPYVTYGIESEADVKGGDVELAPASVRFTVESEGSRGLFDVALTGRFNVYNSLAAISCGLQRKIPMAEIQQAMNTVKPPAGRMEFINEGQEFGVVVDYAHSAGALEKILPAIREFNAGKGRLICVFGCGGDRDHSKRSQMGAVAAELADVVVITSDNPRSEDPEKIVRDIRNGIADGGDTEVVVEVDRRKAIEYAVGIAREGDFIVLAGKGHETYQVLKDTIIHFDDREVAREALRTRKSKG